MAQRNYYKSRNRSGGSERAMNKEKTDLEGIISEITAGMVLLPRTEGDKIWNNACLRSIEIVKDYQRGLGIFQLGTERSKYKTVGAQENNE
jgi:hypothetical protein